MRSTLDEVLRRHFDERTTHLPKQGPGLDRATTQNVLLTPQRSSTRPRWLPLGAFAAAAAALVVVGFILTSRPTRGDIVGRAGATQDALPTYKLDVPGAILVENDVSTARGFDVVLWKDGGSATYLSLTVRRGGIGGGMPNGIDGNLLDSTFPSEYGRAWFFAAPPDELRTVRMWWERTDGDVWLLSAHWYSPGVVPADRVDQLTRWALSIESTSTEQGGRSYEMSDLTMGVVDTDLAGDRVSRVQVWQVQGERVTLLLLENAHATELSNVLDRGNPEAVTVDDQSASLVHTTPEGDVVVGWLVDADAEVWATLTIPRGLTQSEEIIASVNRQ